MNHFWNQFCKGLCVDIGLLHWIHSELLWAKDDILEVETFFVFYFVLFFEGLSKKMLGSSAVQKEGVGGVIEQRSSGEWNGEVWIDSRGGMATRRNILVPSASQIVCVCECDTKPGHHSERVAPSLGTQRHPWIFHTNRLETFWGEKVLEDQHLFTAVSVSARQPLEHYTAATRGAVKLTQRRAISLHSFWSADEH